MAQQGSIICFVIILIVYAVSMNKLDKKYGFDESEEPKPQENASEESTKED